MDETQKGDILAMTRSRWCHRDGGHAAGVVVMTMCTAWGETPTRIYYKLAWCQGELRSFSRYVAMCVGLTGTLVIQTVWMRHVCLKTWLHNCVSLQVQSELWPYHWVLLLISYCIFWKLGGIGAMHTASVCLDPVVRTALKVIDANQSVWETGGLANVGKCYSLEEIVTIATLYVCCDVFAAWFPF
jgi:hypothetical protein